MKSKLTQYYNYLLHKSGNFIWTLLYVELRLFAVCVSVVCIMYPWQGDFIKEVLWTYPDFKFPLSVRKKKQDTGDTIIKIHWENL